MKKATHTATCQLCGARHKLPGATASLALHGYTVDHGFFSGTCTGAGYQPYELAHDALDEAIPNQESYIESLKAAYEKAELDTKFYKTMEVRKANSWNNVKALHRELEVTVVMIKAKYDYRETPHAVAVHNDKELVEQISIPYTVKVVSEPTTAIGERLLRSARLAGIMQRVDQAKATLRYLKDRRAAWFLNAAGVLPVNDNEGKDWVLRSKADTSQLVDYTSTSQWGSMSGSRFSCTADIEKAKRFTERGAKTMISRLRAYKTLEAWEIKS